MDASGHGGSASSLVGVHKRQGGCVMTKQTLETFKPPVKLQLAALWTSVMFLYVYGDYFNMYQPGKIEAMSRGRLGIGLETNTASLVAAIMMTIPSLMIWLSLALPPNVCRWINVL